ncbi:MAG: DEAD/DEAH box helicase [Prevotellaceae bacterium]|jgi:superfamily II DNA/RNA helicase|nr:DEAD/DEAH box helicase [Prevotellaceae bacterium]
MKFEELGFEESLMDGLVAMNFKEMTPVQEKAIPIIMEGRDIIACAQTGTGKTAAYLLPLLNKMIKEPHDSNSVNAIIMSPTRELAQQIDQQLEGFSYFLPVSSVAVYGGNDATAWDQQKKAMQLGADFVVATPGRLISHISMENVDFSKVSYFILDEADRMLDMGFYDDIIQIVKKLPKERQTILFSATMPEKIKKLAQNILQEPVFVNIAVSKPAEKIVQAAYICHETQKIGIIQTLFDERKHDKVIIFSSSKLKVKEVYKTLKRLGLSVGEMHSDLGQSERDSVMLDFKNGKINILVATDIVSRGIDIENVDIVINYDVPHDAEDYIHRIGRTARAQKDGTGLTFVSEREQGKFARIEEFLEKTIAKLPVPEQLGEAPAYNPKAFPEKRFSSKKGGKPRYGAGKRPDNRQRNKPRKKPNSNN